jgi:putative SOS response-associated peptidase YedK
MCGRYTDTKREKRLLVRMSIEQAEIEFTPRYNIAPTQQASIIAQGGNGFELRSASWGLIPSWATDERIGNSLINARGETLTSKPAFREAYKKRRCLVLADGFYEWQKVPGGKQPVYIRMREGKQFAFGGLWERWQDGQREVETFCIVTVEPNDVCARVHDRMPLILAEADFLTWLDAKGSPESVAGLLKPYAPEEMESFPVSNLVNSPRNETADCVKPIEQGMVHRPAAESDLFSWNAPAQPQHPKS